MAVARAAPGRGGRSVSVAIRWAVFGACGNVGGGRWGILKGEAVYGAVRWVGFGGGGHVAGVRVGDGGGG